MTTSTLTFPEIQDVIAARERILPFVRKTPLEPAPTLSARAGAQVFLKLENQQVANSFKPRISFNKLLAMDESARHRGVVASTAGGHGMGLSYAGSKLGVPVHIYLPHAADAAKVAFMERHGAHLNFFPSVEDARLAALERARRDRLTFISAYNDFHVIAGGGTVALEILEAEPATDVIVVGMGGGGIASGMGIALKHARPNAQIWGVQVDTDAVLVEWMKHGRPVPVESGESIAEGLGAHIEEDSITFPLVMRYVDRTLTVTNDEVKDAMAWLMREHNLIVEPSGAAPVAALLKTDLYGLNNVTAVLTGGNVNHQRFMRLIAGRIG